MSGDKHQKLGGSSRRKQKANLSNTFGIKGSSKRLGKGAVTFRKAPKPPTGLGKR